MDVDESIYNHEQKNSVVIDVPEQESKNVDYIAQAKMFEEKMNEAKKLAYQQAVLEKKVGVETKISPFDRALIFFTIMNLMTSIIILILINK